MKKMPAEVLLYARAYAALDRLTPIRADCGELCGRRCCQGDEETGMILFPHEELLLNGAGYRLLPREMQGRRVLMAVCGGRCERRLRPLSCRVYPYAPTLRDGTVRVEPDPRARPVCPLLLPEAEPHIESAFLQTIETTFTEMLRSPAVRAFLTAYTSMLDEYRRFTF